MFEIKKLTNLERLGNAIFIEENNKFSRAYIREKLNETFVLGYEGWVNDEFMGCAYSLKVDGVYTLDGHNKGVSVFFASKVGRKVLDDLFNGTTDIVVTAHHKDKRVLHALVKRLGFVKFAEHEDNFLFVKEK